MASYYSVDVKCPFYMCDDPRACTITCEGVLPGSTVKSHFPDKKAIHSQIGKHCAGDYRGCPWYQVVSIQYEQT